jgi:membrane-anchored protein YejM (alkaline phosphatase superfamily)
MAMNGYNQRRGADLEVLTDPYWIIGGISTTHGLPFGYDTHVPVIFLGPGIRAGEYDNNITPNDIAPTLATILRVETPSGSFGRVLIEMFAQ